MIKPIINKYSSQNGQGEIIKDGISSWTPIKADILRVLGVNIPFPCKPNTDTVKNTSGATVNTSVTNTKPIVAIVKNNGTENTSTNGVNSYSRGPAVVFNALNSSQTISQLDRLKTELTAGKHCRTKSDKKKFYTIINSIEKEIVIDDDFMIDKIDNLISMLKSKSKHEIIKNASHLQHL